LGENVTAFLSSWDFGDYFVDGKGALIGRSLGLVFLVFFVPRLLRMSKFLPLFFSGTLHNSIESICKSCAAKFRVQTPLGSVFLGRAVSYKGKTYPDFLFKRGRPNKNLKLYLQIKKLYKTEENE